MSAPFPSSGSSVLDGYATHGIRADGSVQTSKVQNFLNALRDEGPGAIGFLPPGTVTLDGGLTLASYVNLRGAGRYATLLKWASSPGASVDMLSLASARQEQANISDLAIDGNFGGRHGIALSNDSQANGAFASGLVNPRHRISNVLIRNMGGDGLHLGGDVYAGACEVASVQVYFVAGYGVYTDTPDSIFSSLDVGQAGLDGFRDRAGNNRYVACKAWLSGRVLTTSTGFSARSRCQFIGCDAQDNAKDGVDFFNAINCSFSGSTDTNGARNGSGVGVNMQGATGCSVDIISQDRRGDSGSDPFVQQFAVDLTSATKNNVRIAAGAHGTGAVPGGQMNSDNTIIVQALGSTLVSKIAHSKASHVDSPSTVNGSTVRVETMDRTDAAASIALTNGTVQLVYFTAPISKAVDRIGFNTRGTAQAGATLVRYGLYLENADGSLTLVARTANDTTLLNGTFSYTEKTFDTTGGYPANYTLTPGVRYAIGVIHVGTTTAAQLYGQGIPGNALPPILSAGVASQTDLPTTINPSGGAAPAVASNGNTLWATAR